MLADPLVRPIHGGRLRCAAQRYGIPLEQWLDLSTGINPMGWPVPEVPAEVWQRLPEDDDGLALACAAYFGSPAVLTTAGSQAAIQALPYLRPPCRVGIISPCYAEHAFAWQAAGHLVSEIAASVADEAIANCDVVVLTNPNNPLGGVTAPERLLAWHTQLARIGGWLVVDEAFADAQPQASVLSYAHQEGLIVLRSLGKFFGLAGLRVGFAAAHPAIRMALNERLGPWTVSGPARWITQRALLDHVWQAQAQAYLLEHSARLARLLTAHGLPPAGGCALFHWVPCAQAQALAERCAQQGVLVRSFPEHRGLRFGLPGSEADWQRLDQVLTRVHT